jgi:hypothetical protein
MDTSFHVAGTLGSPPEPDPEPSGHPANIINNAKAARKSRPIEVRLFGFFPKVTPPPVFHTSPYIFLDLRLSFLCSLLLEVAVPPVLSAKKNSSPAHRTVQF